MPEVAITEHGYPRSPKDNVRLTGKVENVKAVPETSAPQLFAQQHLRLGVAGAIPPFDTRSRLRSRLEI